MRPRTETCRDGIVGLLVLAGILAAGMVGELGVGFVPYFAFMCIYASLATRLTVRRSPWAYVLVPLPALFCRFPPKVVREHLRRLQESSSGSRLTSDRSDRLSSGRG
jgi:hypothetical protein